MIVSPPLFGIHGETTSNELNVLDYIALLCWCIGFLFEAVGDYQLTKIVEPTLTYYYEYCMTNRNNLHQIENKLIETLYPYQTIIVNNDYEKVDLQLSSRVKELFIAVRNNNTVSSNEYDSWYSEYLTNYNKYVDGETNIDDYYIFKLADGEIESNTKRVQAINRHLLLKDYDTKYIIYLDEKYLDHINENLNSLTTGHSTKLSVLSLYFRNNYKNNTITVKQDLLESLTFELDGLRLTPQLEQKYFNLVRPYLDGEKLNDGYLLYSISLDSLNDNPNGFYNFNTFRNFSIIAKANYNGYIKIIANEYRFLHF